MRKAAPWGSKHAGEYEAMPLNKTVSDMRPLSKIRPILKFWRDF